jgi:hypothetical protein
MESWQELYANYTEEVVQLADQNSAGRAAS